jgi:uncharacterized protein involved in exopolysaccharide biosynthesis
VQDRDPELIDYLLVLWRWKWLIVIGTLAAIAMAYWSPLRPPATFIASVTVEIDTADNDAHRDVQALVTAFQRGRQPVVVRSWAGGILALDARADSEASARRMVEEALAVLDADLSRLFGHQRERVEAIERERRELTDHAARLRELQLDVGRGDTSVNTVLLFTAIAQERRAVEQQLAALDTRAAAHSAAPPQYGEIVVGPAPEASARLLVLVAALGGLVGFTCLAFLTDYVRHARARAIPADRPSPTAPVA